MRLPRFIREIIAIKQRLAGIQCVTNAMYHIADLDCDKVPDCAPRHEATRILHCLRTELRDDIQQIVSGEYEIKWTKQK